jgi:hypothetical protein
MAIGITTGVLNWKFQDNYVERVMDNAAYTAAHPDDTLVLAGPARYSSVTGNGKETSGIASLLAMGMLQSIQFTQTKPTQPMMAIGSGRSFFVSGKAQTQWTIGRLFINGRNLLRVLYHNFIEQGQKDKLLDASRFDDPAAVKRNSSFFINLDSELFYIPFGMGAIFRSKMHDTLGAFYSELSMINSYAVGINAGQNMILENVTGVSDRLLPMELADVGSNARVPRATVDAVLGFTDPNQAGATTIDDNVALSFP